jgi:hypothetical protein
VFSGGSVFDGTAVVVPGRVGVDDVVTRLRQRRQRKVRFGRAALFEALPMGNILGRVRLCNHAASFGAALRETGSSEGEDRAAERCSQIDAVVLEPAQPAAQVRRRPAVMRIGFAFACARRAPAQGLKARAE